MNSQNENSNKAFHHYGAQGAPRVNADVGGKYKHMKPILKYALGITALGFLIVFLVAFDLIDIRYDKEEYFFQLGYALVYIGSALTGLAFFLTPKTGRNLNTNLRIAVFMAALGGLLFLLGVYDPFSQNSAIENAYLDMGKTLILVGIGLIALVLYHHYKLSESPRATQHNLTNTNANAEIGNAEGLVILPRNILIHIGKALLLLLVWIILSPVYYFVSAVAQGNLSARSLANFFLPLFWLPVFWAARKIYGEKAQKVCFWIFLPLVSIGLLAELGYLLDAQRMGNITMGDMMMPMFTKLGGTLLVASTEGSKIKPRNQAEK